MSTASSVSWLLPDALRDGNPLNVRRRFAGKPETPRAL
jgi:alpha-ketoglutaric semialdehyde dehydrogenase